MKLGLAALDLPPGSAAAQEVPEVHAPATEALTELRELIRGIHPQLLARRRDPLDRLTPREREVLALMARPAAATPPPHARPGRPAGPGPPPTGATAPT